jgi:hypothetical protein
MTNLLEIVQACLFPLRNYVIQNHFLDAFILAKLFDCFVFDVQLLCRFTRKNIRVRDNYGNERGLQTFT